MSSSDEGGGSANAGAHKKYKGIRRRKWGKWVSEIRVPGTQDRLWLGSYATAEAAAVAHDVAFYCLQGTCSLDKLNFPHMLSAGMRTDMSPRSIQKVASDAGMAVDANVAVNQNSAEGASASAVKDVNESSSSSIVWGSERMVWQREGHNYGNWKGNEGQEEEALSISVEDYLY